MIDKQFIESARNIRSEFLSLNKKLEVYKKELVDLSDYLQNVIKDLEKNMSTLDKMKALALKDAKEAEARGSIEKNVFEDGF